jgi:transposase-like protein
MCLPKDSNLPPQHESFACPNRDCRHFGKTGSNISVRGRYGKNHDRILLWCRSCRRRFAATKGSHFQNSHLTISCQQRILILAWQGKSIREIARLVCHDKDTVNRVIKNAELESVRTIISSINISQIVAICEGEYADV